MFYTTTYPSPVGLLTLASDGTNLCGLWLEGQKYFGGSILTAASHEEIRERQDGTSAGKPGKELPIFSMTIDWLDRYFSGKKPLPSELPLAPSGGEFRKLVWELLCEIPYGEVTTYGALAKKAAAKLGLASMSGQAVGGAVSHNPISIIIPCHRVVGSNGSLTGYAGGLDVKRALLDLEGLDLSRFR